MWRIAGIAGCQGDAHACCLVVGRWTRHVLPGFCMGILCVLVEEGVCLGCDNTVEITIHWTLNLVKVQPPCSGAPIF